MDEQTLLNRFIQEHFKKHRNLCEITYTVIY